VLIGRCLSRPPGETGVTFDEAMEIVCTAHEPKPEPNVIYGVDFSRRQAKDENGLA
jgi:hypothetical protein